MRAPRRHRAGAARIERAAERIDRKGEGGEAEGFETAILKVDRGSVGCRYLEGQFERELELT